MDIDTYVQETGRAGRDGHLSQAIMIVRKGSRHVGEEVSEYIKLQGDICRRDFLFNLT